VGGSVLDPASERAYRHLHESILGGAIAGGTRLVEGQLAEKLGVSRTPIREALRRLAQDGLVEAVPRGGAVVRLITAEDIARAYACRAVLEGLAARILAARRTERDLFELREVQRQARLALSGRPLESVVALNVQFHDTLVRVVGDPVIRELLDHLALHTAQYRQWVREVTQASPDARKRYTTHMAELMTEHERLIVLIESGKGDQAEALVRQHLDATAGEMARILRTFRTVPEG
jgi:DNA-binding GntR family transcriptional regulator